MRFLMPEKSHDASKKLFPHQVGFTAPPGDFDAAPTDFLRIAPETVGVHGRLLHVPGYTHDLKERADNFHLLEEVVACMAAAGADVVGQVGTNWVHASGTTPDDIRRYCGTMKERYGMTLCMAGICLVEALEYLNISKIAVNFGYYWPDWQDGVVTFLRQAGLDIAYFGNFVDLGMYESQNSVNECSFIFPEEALRESMKRIAARAPDADAILVIGMPNWRAVNQSPRRTVAFVDEIEHALKKYVVASDVALYWRIFRELGIAPSGARGGLFESLR